MYYPWEREFIFVHLKSQVLFKGEIIAKMGLGHLKKIILKNYEARKAEFYMNAF
jgi:hypothetical protein